MVKRKGRPPREGVPRGADNRIKRSFSDAERALREEQEREMHERNAARLGHWRRVKTAVLELAKDTRLATPLGRMFLLGKPLPINEGQYEAAERLFGMLQMYDTLVLNTRREAKAIDMGGAQGRTLRDDPDPELIARVKSSLAGAEAAVRAIQDPPEGAAARAIVSGFPAVHRSSAIWEATKDAARGMSGAETSTSTSGQHSQRLVLAVEGLAALAKHWRLDEVKESKIRSTAGKATFHRDRRPMALPEATPMAPAGDAE